MKIKSIKIQNFRSIKDEVVFDNISNVLILTWENNSWKSSIINILAIFLWEKDISPIDFYNWTNEIIVSIIFWYINDNYLKKFAEYKKSSGETSLLKTRYPGIFSIYSKGKIDKKDDLETPEQIEFIENQWVENFKNTNFASDELSIILTIIKEKDKIKSSTYSIEKIWWIKIEKSWFLPKVVFIDDERNFSNEQDWKTWSITQKIFWWIEIKKDEEVIVSDLDQLVKEEWKWVKDLEIHHLEKLLWEKVNEKSKEIWIKVTENFCNYYNNWYEIKVTPETTINHKTFSLSTSIIDPNIWETPLNNVWAWLRALYLLSLLKAYNTFQKNENTIFIIEEPELYLHPWLQKKMWEVLNEISKDQQLFITTHSPIILRRFNIEDIKEISKCTIQNRTIKNDWDFNKILEKLWYSIFDIIKYKHLIFVEWKDDYNILEKIINKFYPDKKEKVEIIISNWCWNLKYYASLKFLWLLNKWEINYLILRDGDNKEEDILSTEFETNLISKDIKQDFIDELKEKFKILDRYSIENFFFNETILQAIKTDFSIADFIDKSEEFLETKERWKDSLITKQSNFYNNFRANLESNFNENIKLVRWHNIMNCLLYYIYWEIDYQTKKISYNIFIDSYIDNSQKTDFWVLTQYLDELFWITN